MIRNVLPLAAIACFHLGSSASAQELELEFTVDAYELDNGLQVVLSPDSSSPTVAIAVYYDVGSRNEEEGRSGFAHLFEHMMFQGSANIGKGEHFQFISSNGGEMNGTTSEDRTNYFEILPSDRLALGLWLESDRMRSLDISEENFENQREVVKEERRLRVDNQPYVPAFLAFSELIYDSWEYSHSVIGSMDDLDAAELSDVQAFFDLYYAPNNAVLTIVGDFDPDRARELVEYYFADIPSAPEPPAVSIDEVFDRTERREETVTDALAPSPALLFGWLVPPAPDPQSDAAEILSMILTGGESSVLYDRLIRTEQSALEVVSYTDGRRGPDVLLGYALVRGDDPDSVLNSIEAALADLRDNGITEEAFETARTQLRRDFVNSVEGNLGRALRIGRDALYYDDPDRVNERLQRIDSVTLDDVQDVLETYLTPERMSVMRVLPEMEPEGLNK